MLHLKLFQLGYSEVLSHSQHYRLKLRGQAEDESRLSHHAQMLIAGRHDPQYPTDLHLAELSHVVVLVLGECDCCVVAFAVLVEDEADEFVL